MKHAWILGFLWITFAFAGCSKRDQPPTSAYDPKLIETAKEVSENERLAREQEEAEAAEKSKTVKGECSRQRGGCQDGFICWDSYFCKAGFSDQCSGSGDKMCHKKCASHDDCPKEMPTCRELPLFNSNEAGVLEKFCVAK